VNSILSTSFVLCISDYRRHIHLVFAFSLSTQIELAESPLAFTSFCVYDEENRKKNRLSRKRFRSSLSLSLRLSFDLSNEGWIFVDIQIAVCVCFLLSSLAV